MFSVGDRVKLKELYQFETNPNVHIPEGVTGKVIGLCLNGRIDVELDPEYMDWFVIAVPFPTDILELEYAK